MCESKQLIWEANFADISIKNGKVVFDLQYSTKCLKNTFPIFLSLYMIVTDKISAPKISLNSHLIYSIFFLSFFYFFKVRQGYEESQGVIFDKHVITEKLGSLHMGMAQN